MGRFGWYKISLVIVAGLASSGCSKLSSLTGNDEAIAIASEALEAAVKANRTLDDGSMSGSTMGDEVAAAQTAAEEAQARAVEAERMAQDAESRLADVEARLATICANAPNACN